MNLKTEECEPCRTGAVAVSEADAQALMGQLPHWNIVTHQGMKTLQREFSFPNFLAALAFTNQVGALAEQYDHHPALLTEWGKVTVSWWTHTLAGLHRNDFILAAKTDALFG